MSENEPTTQKLRVRQQAVELEERRRAEAAETSEDTASHQRRAEKAEYLREKLEQREESERQTPPREDDDAQ